LVGGFSALGGALMSIGIPKDSVLRYETALKADKFLLVVHGDAQEILHARELLKDVRVCIIRPAQRHRRSRFDHQILISYDTL